MLKYKYGSLKIRQLEDCVEFFKELILDRIPAKFWVAGGALRDYFSSGVQNIADVDLFFPSEMEFDVVLEWFIENGGKLVSKTTSAISIQYEGYKYDLVRKVFHDDPVETIDNFDFTVCCCACNVDSLYYHETFFIDLSRRRLEINTLEYPLSTLTRLQKYIIKGFRIDKANLTKLAQGIQKETAVADDNGDLKIKGFYEYDGKEWVAVDRLTKAIRGLE